MSRFSANAIRRLHTHTHVHKHTETKEEETENVPVEFKPPYYGPGHLKVISNFIGAVKGKELLIAFGEASLNAIRIILNIYASDECGLKLVKKY